METKDRAFEISCTVMGRKVLDILGVPTMALPEFRLVHRTGSRWGGQCAYYTKPEPRCIVRIQRIHHQSERNLERIVAHEMVHHVVFMTYGLSGKFIGHGPTFQKLAAMVNAVLGDNFVTTQCDRSYDAVQLPRPITMLLWRKVAGGKTVASWHARETPRVRRQIIACAAYPGAETRIVQTRDPSWCEFPKTSKGYGKGTSAQTIAELDAMWDRAQVVTCIHAELGVLPAKAA